MHPQSAPLPKLPIETDVIKAENVQGVRPHENGDTVELLLKNNLIARMTHVRDHVLGCCAVIHNRKAVLFINAAPMETLLNAMSVVERNEYAIWGQGNDDRLNMIQEGLLTWDEKGVVINVFEMLDVHLIAHLQELDDDALDQIAGGEVSEEFIAANRLSQEEWQALVPSLLEKQDDHMAQTIDHEIKRSGFCLASEEPLAGGRASYTYTIGLSESQWPELIISGLDMQDREQLLQHIMSSFRKSDRRPEEGRMRLACCSLEFHVVPVNPDLVERHFRSILSRAERAGALGIPLRVFQILWPDDDGLYPFDPDYNFKLCPQDLLVGDAKEDP